MTNEEEVRAFVQDLQRRGYTRDEGAAVMHLKKVD